MLSNHPSIRRLPSLALAALSLAASAQPTQNFDGKPEAPDPSQTGLPAPDQGRLSVQVEPIPAAPARDHDPAAVALLDAAEAAIAELTSFRVSVRAHGTSIFKGTTDEGTVAIIARRDEGGDSPWRVRITGLVTPERSSQSVDVDGAFNGDRMKWVDRDERSVGARILPVRIASPYFEVPDRFRSRLWINPGIFANERAAEKLTTTGQETINGVECDVVRADMAGGTAYFLVALGVEDHLPRRLVRGFDSRGGALPMSGTESLEFEGLAAGIELTDAAFVIPVPEGYRGEVFPDEQPSTPITGPIGEDGSTVATAAGTTASNVPAAHAMALDFDLKDQQGTSVRLSQLRGRPVLVLFWASWSPWANDLARELRPLREQFPDLDILVLSVRERAPETMRQRFEATRLTGLLLPDAEDVAARYEVLAIPTVVLVGPEGQILHRHAGFDASASPVPELRRLLIEQATIPSGA